MRVKIKLFFFILSASILLLIVFASLFYIPRVYFMKNIEKNTNGLRRFVYDGMDCGGKYLSTSVDSEINYNDITNADFRNKYFSIRWIGVFYVRKNQMYKFHLRSDDGSMLKIDDKIIIDNKGIHPADEEKRKTIFLFKGYHLFILEYCQAEGQASISFKFTETRGEKCFDLVRYVKPLGVNFNYDKYINFKEFLKRTMLGAWIVISLVLFWAFYKTFLIYVFNVFFNFAKMAITKGILYFVCIVKKVFLCLITLFKFTKIIIAKGNLYFVRIVKKIFPYPITLIRKLLFFIILGIPFLIRFYCMSSIGAVNMHMASINLIKTDSFADNIIIQLFYLSNIVSYYLRELGCEFNFNLNTIYLNIKYFAYLTFIFLLWVGYYFLQLLYNNYFFKNYEKT